VNIKIQKSEADEKKREEKERKSQHPVDDGRRRFTIIWKDVINS
jgi:hypothetical protein